MDDPTHSELVDAHHALVDLADRRADALDTIARALDLDPATRARVTRDGDAGPVIAALAARGITAPERAPVSPPWTDAEAAAYRADLRARRGTR